MSKTFHTYLASQTSYRATMLVEVFVNQPFSEKDAENLVANMQRDFFEHTMNIVDAAYQAALNNEKVKDLGGYTYDAVTQDISDETIRLSALRATAFIKRGEKVEGEIAKQVTGAIATELTYLYLRAIEPFYKRFPEAI